MVLKSVSLQIFYPFLTIIGRGAQPMIGGGGGARSDVTVVLVMEQVVNASWRSNKGRSKREINQEQEPSWVSEFRPCPRFGHLPYNRNTFTSDPTFCLANR